VKGIILAGGTGKRLLPLTKVTNKHLLPVGEKPMILHSIQRLVDASIDDIIIITGTEHMGDMINLLGSGSDFGCNLTYRVQDNPDGIAGALRLCRSFVGNDSCVVILGDNILENGISRHIKDFNKKINSNSSPSCMLLLKEVEDPERFGVPQIEGDKILKIIEKPNDPPSNFCVTGIYLYDSNVFDFIEKLSVSKRGEYEITDVNNLYIELGDVYYDILSGWWSDAGTHESYKNANYRSWEA